MGGLGWLASLFVLGAVALVAFVAWLIPVVALFRIAATLDRMERATYLNDPGRKVPTPSHMRRPGAPATPEDWPGGGPG